MPKGAAATVKGQANGLDQSRSPLRLCGCDSGVSKNNLLAQQWGVSKQREIVTNAEQCVNYLMGNIMEKWISRIETNSNYRKFNNREKQSGWRDKTKLHKWDEERVQGEEWSVESEVWSVRQVGWRRRSLLRFSEWVVNLELRGKLLLVFCMVSTVIKYIMLCHAWASWWFHCWWAWLSPMLICHLFSLFWHCLLSLTAPLQLPYNVTYHITHMT